MTRHCLAPKNSRNSSLSRPPAPVNPPNSSGSSSLTAQLIFLEKRSHEHGYLLKFPEHPQPRMNEVRRIPRISSWSRVTLPS
ncbi:hypothetical protein EUGRSUZ_L03595 [Eucalyptus grandis]|uniref:Uncharacterized protein n=1 Tax=Eucalyptus grandis TaxID=71139 RepID=A0AAD9T8B4_EUCGR|nr:hypothetical protein EUGRSUZ_L03595 [Eucalyptus grandis]